MKAYIEVRVLDIAIYILETNKTVRATAKVFGVSKSTVHRDVTENLPKINPQLACEVAAVLGFNKAERHLRGGKVTKLKYLKS